jgi:DNA-binding CsgD family transcriptional regulator
MTNAVLEPIRSAPGRVHVDRGQADADRRGVSDRYRASQPAVDDEAAELPDSPGLIILDDRLKVDSATPGVARWLELFPDGNWQAGRLPAPILSVAQRAARPAAREDDATETVVTRVRSQNDTWMVVHASTIMVRGSRRVVVIMEPAPAARLHPLLMATYGLTERERDVTTLVLQGCSTVQIAKQLVLSEHTVQQHLKSIFDKTGVRSRRVLVGKVFSSQ